MGRRGRAPRAAPRPALPAAAAGCIRSVMAAEPRLKLALVGCGRICELAHHPGIVQHASDVVQVTACVDINEDRAATMAAKIGPSCEVFTCKFMPRAQQPDDRPFSPLLTCSHAVLAALEVALASGDFDAVDLMLVRFSASALP